MVNCMQYPLERICFAYSEADAMEIWIIWDMMGKLNRNYLKTVFLLFLLSRLYSIKISIRSEIIRKRSTKAW